MALVVGLGVLEDEAAGTLQAVGTLFHTVRAIFEVEALHAVLGALRIVRMETHQRFSFSVRREEGGAAGGGGCKWDAHI